MLTTKGGKAILSATGTYTISHAPSASLTLRYQIHNGYAADPTPAHGNPYRPVVRPTWFQLIGESSFITPKDQDDREAKLTWAHWPQNWVIASNLDNGSPAQALSVHGLIQSNSIGGLAVKTFTRPIENGTLRFAVHGAWQDTAEKFADDLCQILSSQRRFWGDQSGPYFVSLITIAPEEGRTSIGGTGRHKGFALYATRNAEDAAVKWVIAHEHLHTWIPRRLGKLAAPEEQDYWFSEGFTEFYTLRTLAQAGVYSFDDCIKKLNDMLAEHDASSFRTQPNEQVAASFWKTRHAERMPYLRGFFLALHWDAQIRAATQSKKNLDDVMRHLRDRFAKTDTQSGDLMRPSLVSAFKAVAGIDITGDISAYVENARPIPFPVDLLNPHIVLKTQPKYERGWKIRREGEKKIIEDVKEDSPAYRAGVRNGMLLLKQLPTESQNENVIHVFEMLDGAEQRLVRYQPKQSESLGSREIVIAKDIEATAQAAVIKLISGDQD